MKRVFLGIKIPKELTEKIIEFQEELKHLDITAKFVEKENFHFNLKFFGDLTKEKIEKVKDTIKKVVKENKRFNIEVKGIGSFPNMNYIKVVWAGVSNGKKELKSLQETLENEFQKIGIKKEKREYIPHLTLCRVKAVKNKKKLIEKIKNNKNKFFGDFEAENIVLIESELTPEGPKYVDLKNFELKK